VCAVLERPKGEYLNLSKLADVISLSQVEAIRAAWRHLKPRLIAHLKSTEREYLMDYVFDSNVAENIPSRTGYLVGLLVAQHAGIQK